MRKLALLSALLVFSSLTGFTQDKFRFGLHISPNIGWIKPDNAGYSIDGSNLGYSYGLIAEFNLSERYAFATGLNILRISGSNTLSAPPTTTNFTIKSQYIDIPLTLKLKTNEIGYFTYYGKFGLSSGILLKSKGESNNTEYDYRKETMPVRLGLVIGLGTEYNVSGSTFIIVGLEFNNGFTNLYTDKAGKSVVDNKELRAASSYIGLNLGVCF